MLLLEYFDDLTIRPDNAERLKELVLELGIRGQLTKSWRAKNSNVIPTYKLLEEIKAEKEELIANKEIRKEKTLPPIASNEIPFDIPKNWAWCRLGEVAKYLQRGKSPKYVNKSDIPVISQKCVQWDGFHLEKARFIDISTLTKYKEERFLEESDLLWNSTGHGTLGRVCLFPKSQEYDKIVADSHVTVIRVFKNYILPKFLYYYSSSPTIQTFILNSATGSTKQTELSTTTLKKLLFCLPPIKEQQEVVKITQQLHQEINYLVSLTTKRLNLKQSYVKAILNRLEEEKTVDIWQYLQPNFIHFFDSLENIQALRQTILQLAVQGKLTANWRKNNVDVEPAEILLQRIQQEKLQLIKDKKIRKEKPLPPIEADEIPFDVPDSWVWCRITDFTSVVRGGSPRPAGDPRYYFGKIPFLKVADLTGYNGYYIKGYKHTIKEAGLRKTRLIKANTLMLTNSGATLGIPRICNFEATFNDGIAAFLNLPSSIDIKFMFFYLKSKTKWFLEVVSIGQGQPNLNTQLIRNTCFPITSLAEQQAIVQIIEELMDFCDQLETKIKENKIKEEQLLVASLNEILGGTVIFKSKYEPKIEKPKRKERISKYDSNTINMDLVELLKKHGKLHAEDLWKMSKFPNDIDAFYAALKEAIEVTKAIKESSEKGYLELI